MSKAITNREILSKVLHQIGSPSYGSITLKFELKGGVVKSIQVLNAIETVDPAVLNDKYNPVAPG